MKKIPIILIFVFYQITASSQSCLPFGIKFSSQDQIDNFQTNYPNCTEIEGFVTIGGYNAGSITNLNGLSVLTSIGGDLEIFYNDVLTSLTGLENLTSIGQVLNIHKNDALTGLAGLDNVTSIEGGLCITYNASLSTCEAQWVCEYLSNPNGSINIYKNATGCNNPPEIANACGFTLPCLPYGNYYCLSQADIDTFQTIYPGCFQLEGDVKISGDDITNLNGLSVLTSISGALKIEDTDTLASLTGLDNVTSIGKSLNIHYNEALSSLTGLENLTSIGGNLSLHDNDALTSLTGLANLSSLGGSLEIGFMYASGNPVLTSLSGLEGLTTIGGWLDINKNPALTSLTGLDNVTFIGGPLWIYFNPSLKSLTGLDNVTTVGRHLEIWGNPALSSLTGLDNVTSIEGDLLIGRNNALASLTGLDKVNSIMGGLNISNNDSLAFCAVPSICNYLDNPAGMIVITGNASGCSSQQEVQEACDTLSVENIHFEDELSIFPNPANREVFISFTNGAIIAEVNIYNQFGQKVIHLKPAPQPVDVSMLRKGMYVIEIVNGGRRLKGKLIKN